MSEGLRPLLAALANGGPPVTASIQSAAKLVAQNLLSYYHGDEPGQVPGILPGPPDRGTGPYYWVRGGADPSTGRRPPPAFVVNASLC